MKSIVAEVANKLTEKFYDKNSGELSAQAFCNYIDKFILEASEETAPRLRAFWNELLQKEKDKNFWHNFESCLIDLPETDRGDVLMSFLSKIVEDDVEFGGMFTFLFFWLLPSKKQKKILKNYPKELRKTTLAFAKARKTVYAKRVSKHGTLV